MGSGKSGSELKAKLIGCVGSPDQGEVTSVQGSSGLVLEVPASEEALDQVQGPGERSGCRCQRGLSQWAWVGAGSDCGEKGTRTEPGALRCLEVREGRSLQRR